MSTIDRPSSLLERYQASIGSARDELPTPALILDLEIVRQNVATMAGRMSGPTKLRAHAKTHKCPQVAKMQIEAGAIGITTATGWEALAMVRGGIDDVLIANEVSPDKLDLLAAAAASARITIGLDSIAGAEAMSRAAVAAGTTLGALIDVEINFNRCGVRSHEEGLALAERISALPGIDLRGVMGWEGHAVLIEDRAERARVAGRAIEKLLAARDAFEAAGYPMPIVSAGGTNTHTMTGANPRVTELQAGVYVFMDEGFRSLVSGFKPGGLTVLTTVISRHGDTVVLDCGSKEIGVEPWGLPQPVDQQATTRAVHEAHLLLDAQPDCNLAYGDRVEFVPGHACTTVSLHEAYHVVEDGVVVDIWPILARGPGRGTA